MRWGRYGSTWAGRRTDGIHNNTTGVSETLGNGGKGSIDDTPLGFMGRVGGGGRWVLALLLVEARVWVD